MLNNDEIIKQLEYGYNGKTITQNALDIINDLQEQVKQLMIEKDDAYQNGFSEGCDYETKIEELAKINEDLQKQVDDLTVKVKSYEMTDLCKEAYIEQLKEENKEIVSATVFELKKQNTELQKQVYDLSAKRKRILANKIYSDETLKKWKKADLIEQIRILEHNWAATEEMFRNSVKNSEQIFFEQKAEIDKLQNELNSYKLSNK